MRRKATLDCAGFFLFLFWAGVLPGFAGSVVVPLVSNQAKNGATYITEVVVADPDVANRHYNVTFITPDVDGSALPPSTNLFVLAGTTLANSTLAASNQTGFLTMSGSTQMTVSARLQVTSANNVALASVEVPVVTDGNALAAGSVGEVLGLEQGGDSGLTTDFFLLNLERSPAQCTIGVFRPDGTAIAAPTTLSLLPLSRRDFPNVFSIVGASTVSGARIEASCDHQFYPFALVYQPGGTLLSFVSPAPYLTSNVAAGGPSFPEGGTGGDTTFSVPGTFLNATASNSEQEYDLPGPAGVAYKRATIDWDLRVGPFPSGLFTGVMAFRRPNNQRSLREPFCAVQVVNRNSKTILDLGVENVLVRTNGPWTQNATYHCKLTYDLTINQCSLAVSQGGTVIYNIAGPAQWFDLSANGNPLSVDFGQTGIGDGAYYPPVGWSFSNLNVLLEPR